MTNKTVLSNEQIGKALHDAGILDLECVALRYDLDVARATEQAVLQSPEIQQIRKDAERYRFIRDKKQVTEAWDNDGAYLMTRPLCRLKFSYFPKEIREKYNSDDLLGSAIDAAMEVKP